MAQPLSTAERVLPVGHFPGLRGASPIVFGLMPLIAHTPRSQEIFATVFCVVVFSVLIQGSSLGWAADRLGISEN